MVVLRSKNEIEGLRRAGDLVARALVLLSLHVRAGVRLSELDRIIEEFIRSENGEPTYKGYRPSPAVPPFPGTVCTAVNEEVVHGLPGPRRLREGDIVGVDVGATLGGWVGDTCYTYPVGEVSPRARKLLDVAGECLEAGISEVGPGKRFGDVGAAIQELAEYHGYGVVRELSGHGIGHELHEEPHINHVGLRGRGMRFRAVEKVGTELTAPTNRARNAPKLVCLVADQGRKRARRGFFNTLLPSTHSGE